MAEAEEFKTPDHPLACQWECIDPGNGSSARTHARFILWLSDRPASDYTLLRLKSKYMMICGGYGYEVRTSNRELMEQLRATFACSDVGPSAFFEGIAERVDVRAVLDKMLSHNRAHPAVADPQAEAEAQKRKRDAEDVVFVASKDPKIREFRQGRGTAQCPPRQHAWTCGVSTHYLMWTDGAYFFGDKASRPEWVGNSWASRAPEPVMPELPPEVREFLDSVTQRARAMPSHMRDALAYPLALPVTPGLLEYGLSMLQCAVAKQLTGSLAEHESRTETDIAWRGGDQPTVALVVTVWRK